MTRNLTVTNSYTDSESDEDKDEQPILDEENEINVVFYI